AGDVEVTALEVKGGNGTFSGTGLAEMPWLRNVKLRVEFSGIFLNTDHQLLRGSVKSVFNPDSKMIVNLDGMDYLFKGRTEEREGEGEGAIELETNEEIVFEGVIADVTIDPETGAIVVIDENGMEISYPLESDKETGGKKSVKIVDSQGGTWVVEKYGNITKGGAGSDFDVPDSTIQERSLTGLDSLVYKAIVRRIEANKVVIDSLKEKMQPFIKEIENVIEKENYYPPRIKGENDELIGEGISLYINVVDKPKEVMERLSPSVKLIDESRNNLIKLDIPIQELKLKTELLNELKEGDPFEEFMLAVSNDNNLPENITEKIQYIEELIKQRINEDKE